MKGIGSFLVIVLLFTGFTKDINQKIIFDVTSTDLRVHKSVMLQVQVMSKQFPNSIVEVMVYGEALPMLMNSQSTVSKEIELYHDNENVRFTACEVSMELLFNIDETALLKGVQTVENAIPDIVHKQNNGWGYIKVGI